jgi:hypothetical protein
MRGNRSKEQRPYPTKKTEIDNRRPSHRKLTFQAVLNSPGTLVKNDYRSPTRDPSP